MTDLDFRAKYEGPIAILKQDTPLSNLEILATHRAGEATLGLTASAQKINIIANTDPNRISGEASFYNEDRNDMLFSTFEGTAPPLAPGQETQEVSVSVTFTGGLGRFKGASGKADVQATFFFDKGISAGSLTGVVTVPEPGSSGT